MMYTKMKYSVLFSTAMVIANFSFAQTIQVTSQKALFSTGEHNALATTIYKNSKDEVVDKWKAYLKDLKNEKVKFDNNELFGDNVLFKEWGNNPVDVYTRFEENKDDKSVKLVVAFDLGGTYLSAEQDATKYALAEQLLKEFAVKTTRSPIEEKLKTALKLLNDLSGDQKDLEKKNKELHGDIDNYKSKISKAEDDIKKNEDAQVKKKEQTETQKTAIEQIKSEIDGVK